MIFVVLMYANNYTGYAPGDPENNNENSDNAVKDIAELEPELPKTRLSCYASEGDEKCGSSCWFKTDNKPAANDFKDAKGIIGIMDWNGNCMEISSYLDNSLCCIDYDCGSGICYEGECIIQEPAPADISAPVFPDSSTKEAMDFVRYLYRIRNSVKGTSGQCAGFVIMLMDRYFKNRQVIGADGAAWDMLASMMKKNKIVCQYPNCKPDMLQPGDFAFFRNPGAAKKKYWSDIKGVCNNIRDGNRICDYNKGGISIPGYPVSTHVGIYGGNNFVFDQFGPATHGTLASRIEWAGYISAIIRPNYVGLQRK